jgi:hypothetical protein
VGKIFARFLKFCVFTQPRPEAAAQADRLIFLRADVSSVCQVSTVDASRQLFQQRFRFFEVLGIEALGEPVVDRGEKIVSICVLALALPRAGE